MSQQTQALSTPAEASAIRRGAVYAVLVVAGLLLLVTSFGVWINRVALNTNEFADTSSTLIDDEAIRRAVATRAVDELYASVNVRAEVQRRLPDDLKQAAGALAGVGREGAYFLVDRALRQRRLQSVWRRTIRESHVELVAVLEGGGTSVSTQSGVVTLDLREIVLDAAEQVGIRDTVEDQLPAGVAEVEILRSDELDTAQDAFQLLKTLAWVLPLVTVLAFALAISLAPGRRRITLRDAGVAVFLVGLVGLLAVNQTGNYVVDSLARDRESRAAGDDAWNILTDQLRSSFRWQVVVGVLLVAAAWLVGPRRSALETRRVIAPFFRERLYPYAAVGALAVFLLLTGPAKDFARLLYVTAFLVVLAVGIELIRRQALHDFPAVGMPDFVGDVRTRVGAWLEARRPAAPAPPPAMPAAVDLTTRLTQLAELHARGDLTDEEYALAKARVLAGD
jgi:hypothetical protein